MSRRPRRDADDFVRDRHHNSPESGMLDHGDQATVEAGRQAINVLQKTFDTWITVGRAVKVLRAKADKDGRSADLQAADGAERLQD